MDEAISQQHPDLGLSIGLPWSIFTPFPVSAADDGGPTLFLISVAIVINACSTFIADFADVSKKGIPSWSANSCSKKISRLYGLKINLYYYQGKLKTIQIS